MLAELTPEGHARRLQPLTELACDEAEPAAGEAPDFVCQRCRTSLTTLGHHLELIELRQENIHCELDAEWIGRQMKEDGGDYVEG